jgi:hypothetical protein
MKTKLLAMVLLAGGSMFAQSRLSIGIGIGGAPGYYPRYPSVQAVVPPCPGPDYNWVDGYWSPYGGPWVAGYWARPYIGGFRGGYAMAPRYVHPGYGNGYGNRYGNSYGNRYGNAYRSGSVGRGLGHQYGRNYQNGFRGR